MFRRALAAVAASAVALGVLALSAVPAGADVSNAAISPSVWQPGEQAQGVVSWTESRPTRNDADGQRAYNTTLADSGDFLSVEVGWGWRLANANPTNTPVRYDAIWDNAAKTYTCELNPNADVVFASTGFGNSGGNLDCLIKRASNPPSSSDPGQQVVLSNKTGRYFTLTANSAISVTFVAGQVTAPSVQPSSDSWRIISFMGTSGAGITTTVRTVVPAADGTIPSEPPVRLDFDGNGGECSPGFVEGPQGTWGTAPTADKCTHNDGPRWLLGFSTSPNENQQNAVFVPPGGPVFFLTNNRLYALWRATPPSAPQDVVAIPGLNSMTVKWNPPASDNGAPIQRYNVGIKGSTDPDYVIYRGVCSTPADVNECTIDWPATNQAFTFSVVARNEMGAGEASAASAAVSPYDFGTITASRPNILLGLGGSRIEASGTALGLAGKSVNAQYKVGNAQDWTTQANAATVNAQGKFNWSRKFAAGANKQNVSIRFTYGTDLVSGTYVLSRGGEAGSLTAPRNIKVQNEVNRIVVTWDPPKFDGGERVTGYTLCANAAVSLCRKVSAEGRGVFQNLATGRDYAITVAARTASRTGPVAEAKKKVSPVEASVQITSRDGDRIEVTSQAAGFKYGAKFRLEAAVAVPGAPASTWRWVAFPNVIADGNVDRGFILPSTFVGQRIAVRLVTPDGPAYSKLSRP